MLRFGLVAFPVEAFNARSPEEGKIAFHQLHAECHSRIHYDKVCPVHGRVDSDEIVSGYEYGKGRYVEVAPEDLDALRTEREKALTIDAFVEPEKLDVIYLDGRMYYLSPAGEAAREPYAVFLAALARQERWGIGQVVFSGKEQVVLVRPHRDALHMALLNYAAEMRDSAETVAALPHVAGSDRKVRLAEQLIESWTDDRFDFGRYEDKNLEKVRDLIEARIEGREVVVPEAEEEPPVINLMDALKQSLGKTREKPAAPASAARRRRPRRGHRKAS